MNIILLSGGSGKRLWPLSNDIRSKQFIKIFQNEAGGLESMVQRVYRQITATDPNADITIATSKKQVSAIRNQLGDKVSICTEPARRDTFPAIVLAVAYLKYKKNIPETDGVIVCPVDPYVDDEYYIAVHKLFNLVNTGKYNLNLMGVEPTYPSEKFGYIIPKEKADIADVAEFREKPSVAVAKQYITRGALWNCGVFGFKINYLLEKAHSLIDFKDYDDLFAKYETLEKISFDYAISERENKISVMRFKGKWEDLGSWNTFTEQMKNETLGNCIMSESCENTNIINELEIPVLAMGMKNTIIAASSDGILVSSRDENDKIKPYVENVEDRARYEERAWGSYTVLDISDGSMSVKISLKKGCCLSYHSHAARDETWTVLSGKGYAIIDDKKIPLKTGDIVQARAGQKHKLCADTAMEILEAQIGNELSAEDKIKY